VGAIPVRRWVVVTADMLNIRREPGAEAVIVDFLPRTTCVQTLAQRAGWLQVQLAGGGMRWDRTPMRLFPAFSPESQQDALVRHEVERAQRNLAGALHAGC
jgi:hypothetical protein